MTLIGDIVVVVGGMSSVTEFSHDVYALNTSDWRWTRLTTLPRGQSDYFYYNHFKALCPELPG